MVGYSIAFAVLVAALNIVTGPVLSRVAVSGVSRRMDQVLGAILGGVEAVLLISAAIVILDTYFGTAGSLGKDPGLGFLKTLSEALDQSTIGQFLIKTTVPLVLTILGPLLPKDVSSVVPTGIPGLMACRASPASRSPPADRRSLSEPERSLRRLRRDRC